MPQTVWRLLETGSGDGATNMAVDEAIVSAYASGNVPPTLRLFTWSPPCLSIGYAQKAEAEVDLAECQRLGIDFVRRPTGGRAILHEHELTYSVVASEADPLVSGGVVESYRKISICLLLGLRLLGLPAQMAPSTHRETSASLGSEDMASPQDGVLHTPACFDKPSDYEITVNGRKIIGSAQVRRMGAVVQHGSILIDADVPRLFALLKTDPGRRREELQSQVAGRLTCLREALGFRPRVKEVAAAIKVGFATSWGITLEPGELTKDELAVARELRQSKYGSPTWNLRT